MTKPKVSSKEEGMRNRLEEIKRKKAPSSFMNQPVEIEKSDTSKEPTSKPDNESAKTTSKIQETPSKPSELKENDKTDNSSRQVSSNTEKTTDVLTKDSQGLKKLRQKATKQRIEDTHTRKTYLVRNDLVDRLEEASGGTHGFKIEFINYAIESALNELENTEFDENE